jgi:hypothetical protein
MLCAEKILRDIRVYLGGRLLRTQTRRLGDISITKQTLPRLNASAAKIGTTETLGHADAECIVSD